MATVNEPTRTTWMQRVVSLDPILFVFAFVYLWLRVQPHLLYHAFGSLLPGAIPFSTDWLFAAETFSMPAAGVVYLTGLLSQGYASSLLGALIIVVMALVLAELTRLHFTRAGIRRGVVMTRLPAVAFFLIVSQYTLSLAACLTVSMGLLFSLVFEKVPCHRTLTRMILYCLMAALGYAVMGAGGVYVFSLMTVIHGGLTRRYIIPTLLAVPVGLVSIWGLSQYVYLLPPKEAFLLATPFSWGMTSGLGTFSLVLLVALYVLTPVAVLVVSGARALLGTIKPVNHKPTERKKGQAAVQSLRRIVVWAKGAVTLSLPTALLIVGVLWSYDGLRRSLFQINASARQKHWFEVIDLARAVPRDRNHISCNHDVNRALYHTGRLPYEMFSFPQNPHALLLTQGGELSVLTQLQFSEVHAELGNINTAEKMASELLAIQGSFGPVIEDLAWINIIKGQDETARVYLNALKEHLGYRDRAEAMLEGLSTGFDPNQAACIAELNSCIPKNPYGVTYGGAIEDILTGLLETNPHNKMAFEYLMAYYLLTRQVQKVAANVGRLDDLGYKGVPTHYEEAMLIHYGSLGQKVDLAKLGISQQAYQRYVTFIQLERSIQSVNRQAALNRLVHEFGTTYFFYCRFGQVGAG